VCVQVLPFTRHPLKYLVTPPETLQEIVTTQLLKSHSGRDNATPLMALDRSVRPPREIEPEDGTDF